MCQLSNLFGYIKLIRWVNKVKLYISLLGDFDIKMNNKSIIPESKRSSKLIKLLEYFITFKNKELIPETIIENLWMDSGSQDPMNMIRGQIFRLRQLLKEMLPDETLKISFEEVYYILEVADGVTIDAEEMEYLIKEADKEPEENLENAINLYNQAIDLYKGNYLSKYDYEMWLVPVRSYYRKMYLKTIHKLIDIYKIHNMQDDIVELIEKAIKVEPNEESLRTILIDTLLRQGKLQEAEEEFLSLKDDFEKRLGISNSTSIKEIQRKLETYIKGKRELEPKGIVSKLEEEKKPGPVKFDSEYFRIIYNSYKRKRKEGEKRDYLGLISLKDYEDDYKEEEYIKAFNNLISKTVFSSLRKGDIYTFWNDTQVLILLEGVKQGGQDIIEERIQRRFDMINKYPINIDIKFIPIEDKEDAEIFK